MKTLFNISITIVLLLILSCGDSTGPSGSDLSSSAEILGEFTVVNTTMYVDDDVTWATEYFYVLKNTDSSGDGVWSNEVYCWLRSRYIDVAYK